MEDKDLSPSMGIDVDTVKNELVEDKPLVQNVG